MIFLLAIVIVGILMFFLFRAEKKTSKQLPDKSDKKELYVVEDKKELQDEIYADENGQKYRLVERQKETARRTYIKAKLKGKYWGEINKYLSGQFEYAKLFEFNIYEVTLHDAVYNEYTPFELSPEYRMPREKLPRFLRTVLETNGSIYEVNLHEPIFESGSIKFNRKLHQEDGHEVFGTIEAIVTGYILDFNKEVYFEREYLIADEKKELKQDYQDINLFKTAVTTGEVEYSGNYQRVAYYYSNYRNTYWGSWKYFRRTASPNAGCFSSGIGIFITLIGIGFSIMLLPQIALLFPFFLILFLLHIIPAKIFASLFRIAGFVLMIGAVIGLVLIGRNSGNNTNRPAPVIVDKPEERKVEDISITDTVDSKVKEDTLIRHFRTWKDYEGNEYAGMIWTRRSDFARAKKYKQGLEIHQNTKRAYDEMVFLLKENDQAALSGVYQLFDSIRSAHNLAQVKFAELIVSFVQDIPYTLIVPDGCIPGLYQDKFIREYLSSENARCDGFEKFGINTPVEFMSGLNGDCDTRTLFLYTILSHYDYDVVLLSSEYYNHSLIGINLPISGKAYTYYSERYVLWETTASNIKPGILPNDISDLNYWRISLKSKL